MNSITGIKLLIAVTTAFYGWFAVQVLTHDDKDRYRPIIWSKPVVSSLHSEDISTRETARSITITEDDLVAVDLYHRDDSSVFTMCLQEMDFGTCYTLWEDE